MRSITYGLETILARRRVRRVRLPWADLEAEAARQGCSPADIFFDLAGCSVPDLPMTPAARAGGEPMPPPPPPPRPLPFGPWPDTTKHIDMRQECP